MRKPLVASSIILLLAIVFVGAIRVYQQRGKSTNTIPDADRSEVDNAERVTMVAGKDSSIFSESENSAGAASTIFSGQNNSGGTRRALLWFNVAKRVPAGARIHSAELILHLSGAAQTETMTREFALHRLLSDWGEGTSGKGGPGRGRGASPTRRSVTWKYRFYDSDSWTKPGGDFDETPSATTSIAAEVDSFTTWDSTPSLVEDVQSWLHDPATNFGWIVIGPVSIGTARRFDSREAEATRRPSLQVQFTASP